MRALLVSILLTALMFAGCADNDAPDEPSPPREEETPRTPTAPRPTTPVTQYRLMTQFNFEQCEGVQYETPIGAAQAQQLIHANYTPRLSQTGGLPAEAQQATLEVDIYQCGTFTAGQYLFEDVWFGFIRVPVNPPADAVDAESHAYIVQMIGSGDILSSIWNVVRYPHYSGNASLERSAEAPAVIATVGDYRWDVATTIPDLGAAAGTFTWYHEHRNGDRLTWTGSQSIAAGTGGAASLAYPEAAPFAGSTAFPGTPASGQGSFHQTASFQAMDLYQEVGEYRNQSE